MELLKADPLSTWDISLSFSILLLGSQSGWGEVVDARLTCDGLLENGSRTDIRLIRSGRVAATGKAHRNRHLNSALDTALLFHASGDSTSL